MKKLLLFTVLCGLNFSFAQVLNSDNFNAYTIGNLGTDITGITPGQGGWLTFSSNGTAPTTSTNTDNTNYQVVANGNSSTNGILITSPNGDKGSRLMRRTGIDAAWATRTTGNNIIELEYDFYTGPVTDSRTQVGMRIMGTDATNTTRTLNGFVYTSNTRALQGVCYLNNGGTPGTFLVNIVTGGLILNADTWYTIGCSYNTVTGETLWRTNSVNPSTGLPATNWIAGLNPTQVFAQTVVVGANATSTPPVPANTVTSSIIFDNYVMRASATSTLLSSSQFENISNKSFSVYPNPVNDNFTIENTNNIVINSLTLIDINGRTVKTLNNTSLENISISELNSGIYFLNIATENGVATKKIIKE